MPLKRDLEGSLIAGSDLLDEAIVAREREQPAWAKRPEGRPCMNGDRSHAGEGPPILSASCGESMWFQREGWPKVRG